jgi:D-alanyl-D-alanine carboxypeptidase
LRRRGDELTAPAQDYLARVQSTLDALRIPRDFFAGRTLAVQHEARELELAEVGENGREYLLIPPAAAGWRELRSAAAADGITLKIVSAFRSLDRQAEIVREKLACGLSLEAIFAASAPPGYSEHHTGRAVDVSTTGVRALEVEFEETPAYRWLADHAGKFGFALSYPRDNPYGYVYEPWHWCYRLAGTAA